MRQAACRPWTSAIVPAFRDPCFVTTPPLTATMRRLRPAPNLAVATLWADLLGAAGIAVTVQREFACGLVGQIPPDQALPEIWVRHDEQHGRAEALLDELERSPQRHWRCPACTEEVEGLFEECWNCGAAMPAGA